MASRTGIEAPPTLSDIMDQVNPSNFIGAVAREFRRVGEGSILVLVYLGFLIASRQGFSAKAEALFPNLQERGRGGPGVRTTSVPASRATSGSRPSSA